MNISINLKTKEITVEKGQRLKLSELFDFIHVVDPDNAGDWVIVRKEEPIQLGTKPCICKRNEQMPWYHPNKEVQYELYKTPPYTVNCTANMCK